MKQAFSIYAIFDRMYPLADRSWKLVFHTLELSPQSVAIVSDMTHEGTDITVVQSGESTGNIKKIEGKNKSSKSQLLRLAIKRYWERSGSVGEFEDFYNERMDVHIAGEDKK